MPALLIATAILIPALFWAGYHVYHDRHQSEPPTHLVLSFAAGLGSARLAPQLGLSVPVVPQRGQVLVTQRAAPRLAHPTVYVRQTGEGSFLLGDSHEDVGFDEGTTPEAMVEIARRALENALAQMRDGRRALAVELRTVHRNRGGSLRARRRPTQVSRGRGAGEGRLLGGIVVDGATIC